MSAQVHDRVSLALASAVASGLASHPEWIDLARGNIASWKARNQDSPQLLACYAEWEAVLEQAPEAIARLLVEPGDRGQRMRQSSPFAGALAPDEVWRIKQEAKRDSRAA